MFKNNSTKSGIFKIVIGNLLIILLAFAYAWWFYKQHISTDKVISELYTIKIDISELSKIQNNILDKELINRRFFGKEKNELTDNYQLQVEIAQKKISDLIWTGKDNIELKSLYLNLQEDLVNLKTENKLLLKYLNEAGNEQTGIYSHLIITENNFITKVENVQGIADIKKYFEQITVYSKVFYLYHDLAILNITNNHIDALLKELTKRKGIANNYNYLRLIDGFQEYKQVFNLFARKLMQIGIRKNEGIRKSLSITYQKFDSRIIEVIKLIELRQKKGNISASLVILGLIIISILISTIFYYQIVKRIKLFITESEQYFLAIIKGESAKSAKQMPNNDFVELQKQMNFFSEKLALTSKMLSDLAERGAVRGNEDVFNDSVFPQVKSIDKHIRSLNKQLKSETNQTLINEWIRKGLASFSDVLRRNFDKPQQHAKEILNNLVDYLNIPMGAIYLPSAKEDNSFDLVGSIAYGKTKNYVRSVIIGEGIIGTAAKEKKTLNITDIPEDYFKVSSGFGEAKPKNIVAIPIKLENKVYGIIELASLNKFKKFELEFIDELSLNLGASFAITDVFLKTKEKLDLTEKDYSLVKMEIDAYKSDIEDLKEKKHYFENRNIESEIINNSINTIALVAELDLDGNIQDLNNAFIELLKKPKENLLQTNYWDLTLQTRENNRIDLGKFWNNVRSGITGNLEQNFTVSEKNIWLSETYIPIKNKLGKVEKIKLIAFNKTDFKLLEIEFDKLKHKQQQKESALNKQITKLKNELKNLKK